MVDNHNMIEEFVNTFSYNPEIFDEMQDIQIARTVEKVNLQKFMRNNNLSCNYMSIQTNHGNIPLIDLNSQIYPLATLYPLTNKAVYIGALDDGSLISYKSGCHELIATVFDASDLMTLISDGFSNKTIYEVLF